MRKPLPSDPIIETVLPNPDHRRAPKGPVQNRAGAARDLREIQLALDHMENVPDVDKRKVARLKKELENGTYTVDSEKIAFRMITDAAFFRYR